MGTTLQDKCRGRLYLVITQRIFWRRTSSSFAVTTWPTPPVAPATRTVSPGACEGTNAHTAEHRTWTPLGLPWIVRPAAAFLCVCSLL